MKVFRPFPCWLSLSNGSVTVLYLSNVTCCLYQTVAKIRTYTQLPSVRGMITILEPLPVKENIYTQLTSVRGMITIRVITKLPNSEQSVKENIQYNLVKPPPSAQPDFGAITSLAIN